MSAARGTFANSAVVTPIAFENRIRNFSYTEKKTSLLQLIHLVKLVCLCVCFLFAIESMRKSQNIAEAVTVLL